MHQNQFWQILSLVIGSKSYPVAMRPSKRSFTDRFEGNTVEPMTRLLWALQSRASIRGAQAATAAAVDAAVAAATFATAFSPLYAAPDVRVLCARGAQHVARSALRALRNAFEVHCLD